MFTSSGYIDAVRKAYGLKSDQAVGDMFGVRQQAIAFCRKHGLSDPLALKVAKALRIDAGEILLVAHSEREPEPAIRAAWRAYVKKTRRWSQASTPARNRRSTDRPSSSAR